VGRDGIVDRALLFATLVLLAVPSLVAVFLGPVMHLGKVVESGTHIDVYEEPAHPYSRALLSAEPGLAQHRGRRSRIVLAGDPPSPMTGSGDHRAACHFAGQTDRDPA